jgi:hypothetical protein
MQFLRVLVEEENGHFLWAAWLNLLCMCLSLRSYGIVPGYRLARV